ncbi:MAG: cell division protein SepF [Adlercreutzia sp.]|uniref:cell division protein SepF n=1 Tax=uncultured Adlercreutzia sp. TaxID=875803 RepID=UPI00217350D2|nr:cell division protein SepF [uncultured Adlercreutzia sp.]MCI8424599.1 cell division protein SepF [Adlercreutzia sp.]
MDGKSMFGDLKSKLGIGRKDDYEEYYDDYEEYDESEEFGDDYGEYGYDESYGRSGGSSYSRTSGSSYDRYSDRYNSVTTREPGERSRGRSTMPRLVSIDDVRARTQVPSLPDDGASSSRRSSGSSNSFRTMVDSSLPPQMTPEGTAAASAAASAVHHARSEGLNSLFESTTPAPADDRGTSSRAASSVASSFTPSRNLKVIAPAAYNDAEGVSTALKLGNAVILNLTATPDALAKRILDFSFGVASALDANVECVGNKVFALTRVGELSDAERSYLRTQGIV